MPLGLVVIRFMVCELAWPLILSAPNLGSLLTTRDNVVVCLVMLYTEADPQELSFRIPHLCRVVGESLTRN